MAMTCVIIVFYNMNRSTPLYDCLPFAYFSDIMAIFCVDKPPLIQLWLFAMLYRYSPTMTFISIYNSGCFLYGYAMTDNKVALARSK